MQRIFICDGEGLRLGSPIGRDGGLKIRSVWVRIPVQTRLAWWQSCDPVRSLPTQLLVGWVFATLAQQVEQLSCKQQVKSSSLLCSSEIPQQ